MIYRHSKTLFSIFIASICLSSLECIPASSAERQELEATLSSTPSSEDASTTVVSSLQEMTVDSEDSIDPQCQDLDELEIHANPENCGEYFIFCVRPVSQEIASQSEAILSGPTSQIKEQYDIHKRSCQPGHLFDGIEKQCMTEMIASCNETYETICENGTIFHKDPMQNSTFIECLNNGTAKRTHCQPLGTIFDEETQICVRPSNYSPTSPSKDHSPKSEPLRFALLRTVVWIISRTNDKLSPWMERVKIRRNLNLNESSYFMDDKENEDNDEQLISNSSSTEKMQKTFRRGKNISETEFDQDEENEDEVLVLTSDTFNILLYYGVIVVCSISIFLIWLAIAYCCSRICACCECDMEDDDEEDEFFKYNPYDKYVMTRM